MSPSGGPAYIQGWFFHSLLKNRKSFIANMFLEGFP